MSAAGKQSPPVNGFVWQRLEQISPIKGIAKNFIFFCVPWLLPILSLPLRLLPSDPGEYSAACPQCHISWEARLQRVQRDRGCVGETSLAGRERRTSSLRTYFPRGQTHASAPPPPLTVRAFGPGRVKRSYLVYVTEFLPPSWGGRGQQSPICRETRWLPPPGLEAVCGPRACSEFSLSPPPRPAFSTGEDRRSQPGYPSLPRVRTSPRASLLNSVTGGV